MLKTEVSGGARCCIKAEIIGMKSRREKWQKPDLVLCSRTFFTGALTSLGVKLALEGGSDAAAMPIP